MVFRAVIRLDYGYDMVPPLFFLCPPERGRERERENQAGGSCCAGHFWGGALVDPFLAFHSNMSLTTAQFMGYYV